MTTRKELITEKLINLQNNLQPYLTNNMFSLADYELSDIVFLLSITFQTINTEDEYKQKIKELILMQEPKFTQFETVFPFIIEFIIWFKKLD